MKKMMLVLTVAATVSTGMLHAANGVTEIKTVSDYEENITKGTIPVVIDFFAEWCGPCKKMGPLFEKLAKEFAGKVKFVKINVDVKDQELQSIIDQYNIRSIPTFVFKKGISTSQRVGAMSEKELRGVVNGLLSE